MKQRKKFVLTGDVQQLIWKDNYNEIVSKSLYTCLSTTCDVVYKVLEYVNDNQMKVQPISYSIVIVMKNQ